MKAMDRHGGTRDTRIMHWHGRARERLAGTVNRAFAEGLLSDRTYDHRLDVLYGDGLVDASRLVGDLTFRGDRRTGMRPMGGGLSHLLYSLRARLRRPLASQSPTMLLVLDDSKGRRLFLGRDSRCDLVLEDPLVSRRHARITFRDGVWTIQDLSSTNGTTLNGRPVGRATLRPGDILGVGQSLIEVD